MCYLYLITTAQEAMRSTFSQLNRYVCNLAPTTGVFSDYSAPPVIRHAGPRNDALGMPPPPAHRRAPVTNIWNTSSPHRRGWLTPDHRCLVPLNFA
jgi:putative SOS response-associated peptidase YedK